MNDDFSWDDVGVVTIQDRTAVTGRMAEIDDSSESSSSTSESLSDVADNFLDLQLDDFDQKHDAEVVTLDDLIPMEDEASEATDLLVKEARAQLAALMQRRERIREIAARYQAKDPGSNGKLVDLDRMASSPRSPSRSQAKCDKNLSLLSTNDLVEKPASRAVEGPDAVPMPSQVPDIEGILQRLRREGLGGDGRKIQEGMEKDQQRSVELWQNFLCDDMPVGGDILPSPDEFYGLK